MKKFRTKVSGIAYVEWMLSLDVSECKQLVPYECIDTSITSYPEALLQELDVNFDGVNAPMVGVPEFQEK